MPVVQNRPIQAKNAPAAVNHQSASITAGAHVDPSFFHVWLTRRIASFDRERRTTWQKLCALLLGMSKG